VETGGGHAGSPPDPVVYRFHGNVQTAQPHGAGKL
jgi:hypothetical protein